MESLHQVGEAANLRQYAVKFIENNLDALVLEYAVWMAARCPDPDPTSKLYEAREILRDYGECFPMVIVIKVLTDRAAKKYASLLIAESGERI